jgi:anaerobic selenocysteine-containing dehydrogenase
MIHVIIDEGLYDQKFVVDYCHGFEPLKNRAGEYSPEKVAEITWIPADKIKAAARLYANNKPGTIIDGMGVEHLENCAEYVHARTILSAIVGNLSVPGGEVIYGPHPTAIPANEIDAIDKISPQQKGKQIGSNRFKLFCWPGYDMIQENLKRYWGVRGGILGCENMAPAPLVYRSMLEGEPYQIRSMITWGSNPLVTQTNTKLVYKALKNLDLYVVVDFMLTPSADLADYVFPTGSWLERPCIWDGYNNANYLVAGQRALPPTLEGEYDHRDDYQFFRGLGVRLGQDWPWESMEEVFDYRLDPMGITFDEFMKTGGVDRPPVDYDLYKKKGFATPTGKVELYSTILEKLGYDPLPVYREPSETPISQPALAREFPLILITGGRHRPFFHTEFRQVDSLRKEHPHPLVQIHPQAAERLGIADGDWTWIETKNGRVRQKCQIFDGIDPRVVHAQHGWWFPELPGEEPWLHGVWESNINVCIDDDPDILNPIIGAWPLRTFLCKVYKCKTWD